MRSFVYNSATLLEHTCPQARAFVRTQAETYAIGLILSILSNRKMASVQIFSAYCALDREGNFHEIKLLLPKHSLKVILNHSH